MRAQEVVGKRMGRGMEDVGEHRRLAPLEPSAPRAVLASDVLPSSLTARSLMSTGSSSRGASPEDFGTEAKH